MHDIEDLDPTIRGVIASRIVRPVAAGGSALSTLGVRIWRALRRRAPLIVSIGVLGWSLVELVNLALTHTAGARIAGVAAAGLASVAGFASVALTASGQSHRWATRGLLVLWGVVALAGVAGTIAHVLSPLPGAAPGEALSRPALAPLVFTLLGLVGGAALALGSRAAARPIHEKEQE
jgi:hypothetical protein